MSVQAEILNLLGEVRRERNLTYIMVSHDLAVIAHICDRVGVMQQGQIEEVLGVDTLLAGEAKTEYTRTLFEASRRYDRSMVSRVVTGASTPTSV